MILLNQTDLFLSGAVFAFFWAFLLSIFAIPSVIYLSFRKHLLDQPNNRKVHKKSIPRLGGMAIFAGFTSAITIFGDFTDTDAALKEILAGCILLFFVGLKDDISPISAFKKFFIQILATGVVVFLGEVYVTNLHGFLGIYELKNLGISFAFTFIMIIGVTNAINLIDGLNGLAGSLIVLMCFFFSAFYYSVGSTLTVLALAIAGAFIGFLRYNFIKGKIFMGDSGSLVGGFVVAVLGVQYLESDISTVSITPQVCIAILVIPIFDTLRVFLIRIMKGRSPFSPDKNHIHHKMLSYGFSQVSVVVTLLGINVLLVLFAYFTAEYIDLNLYVLGYVIIAVAISFAFKYFDKRYAVSN